MLDLHCDAQATLHLYGLTPQAALCEELGALMGAQAILLATESGDSPFRRSLQPPLVRAAAGLTRTQPLPLACFSTTVELRGEADTSHAPGRSRTPAAIVEFLRRRGVLAGPPAPLPRALCQPTPLAASEPMTAPCCGVVVFHQEPGARVQAGELVADIVDVDSGEVHAIRALSSGVLYARMATRWATPGKRLAKIAGTTLARTGKLLSA